MLQAAIDLQQNAVEQLVHLTAARDEITFKAPTGSGKTYMMADMMHRILEQNENVVFLVSTLSKSDLAKQNFDKFEEYAKNGQFKILKPYLISSEISGEERLFVPTGFNVYLLPRDLYKKGGRLMQGAMEGFLTGMTLHPCFAGQGKVIYLIKDECHILTGNLDNISARYFTKVYNFSATPKLSRGQRPDVEITNDDAVAAKLIKHVVLADDPEVAVGDAIDKFQAVKANYRNVLGVNPCLIIQISNKDKADAELEEVYRELNKAKHVDLKWMLIVNDDKACDTNDNFKAKKLPVSKWKDYAKESASTVDIIIFKMMITEGWDIPRACMLYQTRDSKSKQLDEQVMGRVRRNPRLSDFETLSEEAQQLAMTSWIWGIIPDDLKKTFGVKLHQDRDVITNEIRIVTTRLKPLSDKDSFDIAEFLGKQATVNAPTGIFKLYADFQKAAHTIQAMCNNYTLDYTSWRLFTENIAAIVAESNKHHCNYAESMETAEEVSFYPTSYYTDNGFYVNNLKDWIWKRNDGQDKFSFDSDAEQQWAEILKDLTKEDNDAGDRVGKRLEMGKKNPRAGQIDLYDVPEPLLVSDTRQIYLWGKNYIPNSTIKFAYYLDAPHSSYPDFVMMDSYGRIHIFEVKSVNISKSMAGVFDNTAYKAKVEELKKAYKQASKLTDQRFYLPILRDDRWRIFRYAGGMEKILTKEEFFDHCKQA